VLVRGAERRAFGGGIRLIAGVIVEIVLSALIAPSMMVFQSSAVVSVLAGRDSGWQVQRRDDGSLPFDELMRRYGPLTLVGLLLAAAAYAVSFSLFLWMTPVTVGLSLSMPLAAITARKGLGGVMVAPEERTPPAVLVRANTLAHELGGSDIPLGEVLRTHPGVAEAHLTQLPPPPPHRPGDIDRDLVIAKARLAEFDTIDQAMSLLTAREKRSILSDPDAFRSLMALARR